MTARPPSARALLARAYDARTATTRLKHARAALAIDPDLLEAYEIVADHGDDADERLRLLEDGAVRGRRQWAHALDEPEDHHFWLDHDTRPFLRVLHLLALERHDAGDAAGAIAIGEEMLRLNPNDNQGIRELLADWYGAAGRWDEAAALLARYPDDWSTSHAYTRWLLRFRAGEPTDDALAAALGVNPHVPAFLADPTLEPDKDADPLAATGYVTLGSPAEAHGYADAAGPAWRNVPGAVERLLADARQK